MKKKKVIWASIIVLRSLKMRRGKVYSPLWETGFIYLGGTLLLTYNTFLLLK